jgi:hypothetical protein
MSDTSRSETTEKTAGSDLPKIPHSEGRKNAELWKLSALEVAAAVSEGVVEVHLQCIAEVNPSVNAVTNILEDGAQKVAEETDRRATGMPIRRMLTFAELEREGDWPIEARKAPLEEHRGEVARRIEDLPRSLGAIDAKMAHYRAVSNSCIYPLEYTIPKRDEA